VILVDYDRDPAWKAGLEPVDLEVRIDAYPYEAVRSVYREGSYVAEAYVDRGVGKKPLRLEAFKPEDDRRAVR